MNERISNILDLIQFIGILVFLVGLTLFNISTVISMENKFNDMSHKLDFIERQAMCDGMEENGDVSNGYYVHDKYYCVWTKDRTEEEINDTDVHEACHSLIYEDPIHFCENYVDNVSMINERKSK